MPFPCPHFCFTSTQNGERRISSKKEIKKEHVEGGDSYYQFGLSFLYFFFERSLSLYQPLVRFAGVLCLSSKESHKIAKVNRKKRKNAHEQKRNFSR